MLCPLQILLVDDDPLTLTVLQTYLTESGHRVHTCESGEDALALLDTEPIDLVISDVQMMGMDGFELLKVVRKRFSGIGFVIMTAYQDRHPIAEALEAGADGYISKPFSLNKFSLIFEREYWAALQREDWWEAHAELDA